jgi:hypothetical protein
MDVLAAFIDEECIAADMPAPRRKLYTELIRRGARTPAIAHSVQLAEKHTTVSISGIKSA